MTQTILVVDDSATMRRVMEMALKGSPYRVVAVGSGEQALQAAFEQRPALVVLDYHLPDRSGMDVCRALKNDPNLRSTPVLMVGGAYHSFDEDQARQSGCDDVITKPFKTDPFTDKVNELVRSGASASPAHGLGSGPAPRVGSGSAPRVGSGPAPGLRSGPSPGLRSTPGRGDSGAAPSLGAPSAPGSRFPSPGAAAGGRRFGGAPVPQPPAGRSRFGGAPGADSGASPMASAPRGRFGRAPSEPPPGRLAPLRKPEAAATSPGLSPGDSNLGRGRLSNRGAPAPAPAPAPVPVPQAPPIATEPPAPMGRPAPPTVAGSVSNVDILKAAGLGQDDITRMVREEVQKAVREQMLSMVRSVINELFQEKVMPRLIKFGEDRIKAAVANDLKRIMEQRVDQELARLSGE